MARDVKGDFRIIGTNSEVSVKSYGIYIDGKDINSIIYEELKHLNTGEGYDNIDFIANVDISINVKPNSLKLENTMKLAKEEK